MGRGPSAPVRALSKDVSDVIKSVAEAKGYSDRGLALAVGIDESTMRRMLNGKRGWTLTELEAVCEHLALKVSNVVRKAERLRDERDAGSNVIDITSQKRLVGRPPQDVPDTAAAQTENSEPPTEDVDTTP